MILARARHIGDIEIGILLPYVTLILVIAASAVYAAAV